MRQRGIKIRGGHLDFAPYNEAQRVPSSLMAAGAFALIALAAAIVSAVTFPGL
jgi:hypothetical protein